MPKNDFRYILVKKVNWKSYSIEIEGVEVQQHY